MEALVGGLIGSVATLVGVGFVQWQEARRDDLRHRREQTKDRRAAKRQALCDLQAAVSDLADQLEAAPPGMTAEARRSGHRLETLASRLAAPDLLRLVREFRVAGNAFAERATGDEAAYLQDRLEAAASAVLAHAGGIFQQLLATDPEPEPRRLLWARRRRLAAHDDK